MKVPRPAYYQVETIRRHIARAAERSRGWQPRKAVDRHQVKEYALERMFGVRLTEDGAA